MILGRVGSIGLLIFAFLLSKAQPYNWLWSSTPGGKIQLYRNYIYSSNTFTGSSIKIGDSTYENRGGADVLLVKRDLKGNTLWARTIGGPNNESLESITVDGQGNIYLAGTFSGSVQADGVLTSNGGKDVFVVKYNPLGEIEWMKNIGNSGDDSVFTIGADNSGRVMISGTFTGSLSIGPFTLIDTAGRIMSISFLSSDGTVLRATNYREPIVNFSVRRRDKYGNIYYSGVAHGPISLGGITITPSCVPIYMGITMYWAAKLDSAGHIQWLKDLAPCSPSMGYYLRYLDFFVDENGNSYFSYVDGLWPASIGPSFGDPYSSITAQFSTSGIWQSSIYLTYSEFLGNHDVLRYVFDAIDGKMILQNSTYGQLEYHSNKVYLQVLLSYIPSQYRIAKPDTVNDQFYFSGDILSKLGKGAEANAGADRYFCGTAPSSITLGGAYVAGSFPPYRYDWSPTTGLNSNTSANPILQLSEIPSQAQYILTVSSSGNVAKDTVLVTKGAALAKPSITANNNVLFTSADGWFRWYIDDSPLYGVSNNSLAFPKDGYYRVKATDGNLCSAMSDTFFAYKIIVNAGNDTNICQGANVKLGGNPTASTAVGGLTYQWMPAISVDTAFIANPTATPQLSTNFKVIVRNSYGNNAVDSMYVTVRPSALPIITQSGNILHASPSSTYQWFLNGHPVGGAIGQTIAIDEEGIYTVLVTTSTGCTATSLTYDARLTTLNVSVAPSVATSVINITYNLPLPVANTVDIFNIGTGVRTIVHSNFPEEAGVHTISVSTARFPKGTYLVRITAGKELMTNKFVVQ